MIRRVAGVVGSLLAGAVFVALAVGEREKPLRGRETSDSVRRVIRNLAIAGLSGAAIQVTERPVTAPLARLVARRRLGLLPALGLPRALELAVSIALMDYTLYVWHRMLHQVPLLWRFHRVHHSDLDMDTTTAIRFHLGEFVLGTPFRAAQILLIGVGPGALALWQRLTLAEVVFHHSNLRLPIAAERRLVRLIVTPRMHGIHHSVVPGETDANWSSGLTLWDWLHGTLKLNVPQDEVTIGVPEYRRPEDVTVPRLLAMPFGRQRRATRPPTDRLRPARRSDWRGRRLGASSDPSLVGREYGQQAARRRPCQTA